MRRHFGVIVAAVFLAQALASGQAAPAPATRTVYTTGIVVLHTSPKADSPQQASLAAGTKLTIGKCAIGWCQVLDTGKRGSYVAERYLSATPPATTVGKGYTNSRGAHVPSPTTTADGKAPAGATAQCRDGSYSFSASRRGTCSHHGGVARWL
jgi:uncharacterized protein YgiM (DUF1202 family)